MDFPGDGSYVVPQARVPVTVRGEKGHYVEPGDSWDSCWRTHRYWRRLARYEVC